VVADTAGSEYVRFGLFNASSAFTYTTSYALSDVTGKTLRFTTKNGQQYLYLSGTKILGPIQALASAVAAKFLFVVGGAANYSPWSLPIDLLRYTNNGAYDPDTGISTSSGNLVCLRDELWVSATDTGVYKTNANENTTGHLVSSKSANHMQTVSKFYRAVDVTTERPLSGGQTINCEWCIDGQWYPAEAKTATTSTSNKHTWTVNTEGQDVQLKFTLARTSDVSPRWTGAAVRFLLPHSRTHTFTLNCMDNALMRNNKTWDVSADVGIANLFSLTDSYVTIQTDYDSSIEAKVDSVEWIRTDLGLDGHSDRQGVVKVVFRELA